MRRYVKQNFLSYIHPSISVYCITLSLLDSCYNRWSLVYNSETLQSRSLLRTASKHSQFKTKYVTEGMKIRTTSSTGIDSSYVWAQIRFGISKSSWNKFDLTPKREFEVVTDTHDYFVKTFDIAGPFATNSSSTKNTSWYIKDMTDGSPCIENNQYGKFTVGDFSSLLSRIRKGSAVNSRKTVFVNASGQVMAAEGYNFVGMDFNRGVLRKDVYLSRIVSDGHSYYLLWYIDSGSKRTYYVYGHASIWCTDDCWVKVFTADQVGKGLHGSSSQLAQAVLSGHQLRVYTQGVASATKAVYIHGRTVSASLWDMLEPIGVSNFDQTGKAQRKIVSSDGLVQTRRYIFETDTILDDLQEHQSIDWFVDTREWIKVLSITRAGQILTGSVSDLRQKVLKGASVRIVVEFNSGVYQIVEAEYLELSPDGHVAADVLYHPNIEFTENNITLTPASQYHLWSAIITTEGDFKVYLYTYKKSGGQHVDRSADVHRYDWFVQD